MAIVMQTIKQESEKITGTHKKGMSALTGFTFGILVCGILIIGVLWWNDRFAPRSEVLTGNESQVADASTPPGSTRTSPSREHLDQGKAALRYGSTQTARSHLEKVTPKNEEYTEAQKILDELDARPTTDRWELDARRERYGDKLKERFRSQGVDVDINVAMSTLFINYQPTERERVYKIVASMNIVPELKRYGFVSYVLTDREQEDIRSLR